MLTNFKKMLQFKVFGGIIDPADIAEMVRMSKDNPSILEKQQYKGFANTYIQERSQDLLQRLDELERKFSGHLSRFDSRHYKELHKLEDESMQLYGMTRYPWVIDALHKTDVIAFENPFQYSNRELETGGKIRWHEERNGFKRLVLKLIADTEDTGHRAIKLPYGLREDEIGNWHCHPLDFPALPSVIDMFPLSGMDFSLPHYIITKQEGRLYIPSHYEPLLGEGLKKQLTQFSIPEDLIREVRSYGVSEKDKNLFATSYNLSIENKLLYLKILR